jgi:hypothetical protein
MSSIDKFGGGISESESGSTDAYTYEILTTNPDQWLTTFFRALGSYVATNLRPPEVYDVRFSFPDARDLADLTPFPNTIVHFEIDDVAHPWFGFGDNIVEEEIDMVAGTYRGYEALCYIVNLDVGIWCSARAGGVTQRMVTFEKLHKLLDGAERYLWIREHLGMEILSFEGGQFIVEEINDIAVHRTVGMTLRVRVYARNIGEAVMYIDEIGQIQNLEIRDNLFIDGLPITG